MIGTRVWASRPQPLRCLLICIVLTLLAAACNGDDEPTAPPLPATDTPSATEAMPTATVAASETAPSATLEPTTTTPPTTAPSSPATLTAEPTAEPTTKPPVFDPTAVQLDLQVVAEGFTEPLLITHAGDGSGRIFVVERGGTIRLLDGSLFLDITDRVGSTSTEQGLLGLAFDLDFASTGEFYVNYTDLNGDTVISRFTLAEDGLADPASEQVLLTQDQPAVNHNGGMLAFGPDGYLYIGLGDGGRSYDAFGTAQDLSALLGKILRIDVNSDTDPYGIPPDNPFVDGERPEIWAFGLRNPWRFTFDRATGDLYIADVGQNTNEWVHFQPADSTGGENYRWPIYEGTTCLIQERCDEPDLVAPIAEYGRDGGCAIIGGHVYRGESYPALQGAYLFGDLCSGFIWATARDADGNWQTTRIAEVDAAISSFGEDERGEIYLTDLDGGRVLQVETS